MSKLDNWIDSKIVQNLFIWFFLFLILLTAIQADNRALTSLFVIALLAPAVYLNNLVILSFLRKKTFVFFLLFFLNILLFATISVLLINNISEQSFKWDMFINFLGIMVLAMVFASAIKIARDSFTRRQQDKEAELKLLKGQLNPHFLFNTLNNLYGLSVVKSDKLPNLMLKLSNLLRYSLYETKEEFVPLEKEISYLENYMSLEKIRLEDKTDIQFIKSGNFTSKQVAPMLFIVFVENAFKHLGVLNNEKSSVYVSIEAENDTLIFKCKNSMDSSVFETEHIEKGRSGIGLNNAKQRLELLYPDKHLLNTNTNSKKYSVELILDL
ncbi:MAG: histidine kinase [Cellulophaga sp.]